MCRALVAAVAASRVLMLAHRAYLCMTKRRPMYTTQRVRPPVACSHKVDINIAFRIKGREDRANHFRWLAVVNANGSSWKCARFLVNETQKINTSFFNANLISSWPSVGRVVSVQWRKIPKKKKEWKKNMPNMNSAGRRNRITINSNHRNWFTQNAIICAVFTILAVFVRCNECLALKRSAAPDYNLENAENGVDRIHVNYDEYPVCNLYRNRINICVLRTIPTMIEVTAVDFGLISAHWFN